jgi:hypothetical protein
VLTTVFLEEKGKIIHFFLVIARDTGSYTSEFCTLIFLAIGSHRNFLHESLDESGGGV